MRLFARLAHALVSASSTRSRLAELLQPFGHQILESFRGEPKKLLASHALLERTVNRVGRSVRAEHLAGLLDEIEIEG